MRLSVGTFNLNNLFSRFNFSATVGHREDSNSGDRDLSVTYTFGDSDNFTLRKYKGRLVKGKNAQQTGKLAERILRMDLDVLAVQEVEHISILRQFNRNYLGGLYNEVILVEGNDDRLIDVGLMSKFPIGAITSFQTAVHPEAPTKPVFGRDLLAVEILNRGRKKKLFTIYNTHLKSHYVDYREDPDTGKRTNDRRRKQQAEVIAEIITKRERKGAGFMLVGDMNDPVDSPFLKPMLTIDGLPLMNGLADPLETRPAKAERQGSGPQTRAWSYRYNPPGADSPPQYALYDQIWLSQKLGDKLEGSHIDRRTKHSGDGSDHDPTWVELSL